MRLKDGYHMPSYLSNNRQMHINGSLLSQSTQYDKTNKANNESRYNLVLMNTMNTKMQMRQPVPMFNNPLLHNQINQREKAMVSRESSKERSFRGPELKLPNQINQNSARQESLQAFEQRLQTPQKRNMSQPLQFSENEVQSNGPVTELVDYQDLQEYLNQQQSMADLEIQNMYSHSKKKRDFRKAQEFIQNDIKAATPSFQNFAEGRPPAFITNQMIGYKMITQLPPRERFESAA